MSPTPPIPESLWNTVPPDAQAALMAVFESLRCRIAELEQRVADLEARLRLNSTNSSNAANEAAVEAASTGPQARVCALSGRRASRSEPMARCGAHDAVRIARAGSVTARSALEAGQIATVWSGRPRSGVRVAWATAHAAGRGWRRRRHDAWHPAATTLGRRRPDGKEHE